MQDRTGKKVVTIVRINVPIPQMAKHPYTEVVTPSIAELIQAKRDAPHVVHGHDVAQTRPYHFDGRIKSRVWWLVRRRRNPTMVPMRSNDATNQSIPDFP